MARVLDHEWWVELTMMAHQPTGIHMTVPTVILTPRKASFAKRSKTTGGSPASHSSAPPMLAPRSSDEANGKVSNMDDPST